MAKQRITITVTQDSSSARIRIAAQYTSDGVVVKESSSPMRNPGGATIDMHMLDMLRAGTVADARAWMDQERVF